MTSTSKIDRLAELILIAVIALLPIAVVPTNLIPFSLTKMFLLFGGVLSVFVLCLFRQLREGEVVFPRHPLLIAAWIVPVAYVVAALFSDNIRNAFVGRSLEPDTAAFFFIGALLLSLTVVLIRSKSSLFRLYVALLASFGFFALFQGIRLIFGAEVLSLGFFTSPLANLLGKWNDVAIFSGLVAVLSLISLEALSVNRRAQILLSATFFIALALLIVVNFSPVWGLLGVFSFGFFIYHVMRGAFRHGIRYSAVLTTILLLSSIGSLLFATALGNTVSQAFGTGQIEARPSWQSTVGVIRSVYQNHAFLGSGPNTFGEDWSTYRPLEVNATPFWGNDFDLGVGSIPTSFATTGLLGALAWLLFLGFFLYSGVRSLLLTPASDKISSYLSISSYLGALYLWGAAIIYTPSPVLLAFAFLFTGVFISSTASSRDEWRFSFAKSPRIGFALVLAVSFLLLASVVSLFVVSEKYLAGIYFQRALAAGNERGDLALADTYLSRAIALDGNDHYLSGRAQEKLLELNRIVSDTSLSATDAKDQFQNTLSVAINDALTATKWNPNDYHNWMVLGQVYQTVVPLKLKGAYESAIAAYERAGSINHTSPLISLALAQTAYQNGDAASAKQYITEALQKKNDYTDAVYLLSQIEIAEGKTAEAISSTEAATVLDPQNAGLFFQLGVLRYGSGNNEGAVEALERAVALNDSYANARYYLGLAYHKLGRTGAAMDQFRKIQQLNPDNKDVQGILANLEAGRDPLSSAEEKSLKTTTKPPLAN